ncbi:nucleotide-binding alpha-beta plait domain-containing protein, partial [Tanacetum coccineum]
LFGNLAKNNRYWSWKKSYEHKDIYVFAFISIRADIHLYAGISSWAVCGYSPLWDFPLSEFNECLGEKAISLLNSSEDGVNNTGLESVTNEVEMAGGSEVSIDNLENMELNDKENMPNDLLLSVSELDEEVYVNQPLSIVSSLDDDPSFEDLNCFQNISDEGSPRNQEFGSLSLAPDSLCLLSKSHSWPNCDDLDADDVVPAGAGSPLPDEKQHSTPANTDADSNSMNSDDNFVASADVSIVLEQSEEKMSFMVVGLYNASVGLLWRPSLQPLAKFSHRHHFNRCYTASRQEAGRISSKMLVKFLVRFTIREDRFAGYGHTVFATPEAAQKALKLNKKELMGHSVRLELAKERGAFTPGSRNEKPYKKAQGTVFVPGFDTKGGLDNVRSCNINLLRMPESYFGNCGRDYKTFIVGGILEGRWPRDDSSEPRRTPESVKKEGPGKRARPGSDNRSHEPRRPFGPILDNVDKYTKHKIYNAQRSLLLHSFYNVKT